MQATLRICCQACGANIVLEPHMKSAQCPYCASTSVVERPPSEDQPDPTFVVGFVINHDRAVQLAMKWIQGGSLFARSDFKNATAELIRGVYLPVYLYGAVAHTDYSAQIGENYTVVETYTTTDNKGNMVVKTRTVTKTEWRSLRGEHSCYILDVVVSASKGVSNDALEAIEPFDMRALRRYSPDFLSGWLAEDPSRSNEECFHLAHDESVEKVGTMLQTFMPGDSSRDLQYRTSLSDEVIDLVLIPVWSFAVLYNENKPPVRVLVNGQTGKVAGKVPISAIKVTIAVVTVLAVIGGVALLFLSQN